MRTQYISNLKWGILPSLFLFVYSSNVKTYGYYQTLKKIIEFFCWCLLVQIQTQLRDLSLLKAEQRYVKCVWIYTMI